MFQHFRFHIEFFDSLGTFFFSDQGDRYESNLILLHVFPAPFVEEAVFVQGVSGIFVVMEM